MKLTKAERHAMRKVIRSTDCVTALQLVELNPAEFAVARAEMRKRKFTEGRGTNDAVWWRG